MADAFDPRPTSVIFAEVWGQRENIKNQVAAMAAKVAAVFKINPGSALVNTARQIAMAGQAAYDNMLAAQTGGSQKNVIDRYRDAQRAIAQFGPAIAAAQSAPVVAGSVAPGGGAGGAPTASAAPVQPGTWANVASQALTAATRASSPSGFVATGPDTSTGPRPADAPPAFDAPAQGGGGSLMPVLIAGAAALAFVMIRRGKGKRKKVRA